MTTLPHPFGVSLKQSDGTTARSGATIVITNERTEETQTAVTNSQGQVVFDLANFSNGYVVGDIITVEKQVADSDMEYFVTANGTETYPAFVQVENETRTRIYPNTARFKLNTTNYPGGKGINFTLN